LIGPVFTRELVTAPRRLRFYVGRAVYVAGLAALVATAWLLLTGTQEVRNVGDMARFGSTLFQIVAPLQLALALFFAPLLTASAVAQEKDRRTLVLLLMTNLSNRELVLGKLCASLLLVMVPLAAAVPLFFLMSLFGGISFAEIGWVYAVTVATAVAAGSIGSVVALWREKTFQTLALVFLALMFWLAAGEGLIVASGAGMQWQGAPAAAWGSAISPWRAVLIAARPDLGHGGALPCFGSPLTLFLAVAAVLTAAANAIAIWRVRIWNPSREIQFRPAENEDVLQPAVGQAFQPDCQAGKPDLPSAVSVHAAPGTSRDVWDNPILWREIRTWAYGRKVLAIRLAYLMLGALSVVALRATIAGGGNLALTLAPLVVLSLMLVNALAVTSITTERDLGALDLLLVTDVTPAEFIFGKLGGIFYVAKEMVVLPLGVCLYLWLAGAVTLENLVYLLLSLAVAYAFVATLGIHTGVTYVNSRSAVAVSLGTLFFLLVGVATCIRIMMSFSGSFELQLTPFLVFMVGGGISMFVALGLRNPSAAIGWASLACPVFTFVAITNYLQEQTLGVFLIVAATYGFTTAAMLIPAIYEFDVATGRTTGGGE
jgi:ABC-type transport system involved in multi-copper enzyme maturation permease subunit